MSTVWGPRVERRVSRYIPYQAPKIELFAEITTCYFCKKLHLMFEICLKWFWIRLCITWKHNLSSEKESDSHNNHYENVYDEDCFFSQGVGKIWKIQKSLRQEINDFQYYDRPFPKNACGQFVLISSIL